MIDKSKYRLIADGLRIRIRNGELPPGQKFYTRKQLCEKFGISLMTAFNVQKILQEQGLISNIPGVGFFINPPETYSINQLTAPVRKIRMIGSPQALGADADFGSELVAGVREKCAEKDLQFNLELVQVLNNPARIINTSRRLDADEALVIFLHDELLPEVVNLLISPEVRVVTVNRTFPDKPAVLPDLHAAMKDILDFCRRKGAKKLLYTGQCSSWIMLHHESEFFRIFNDQRSNYGFEVENDFSGTYPALTEHIKSFQPDAVIFPNDASGIWLRDHHFAGVKDRPLFVGFGDTLVLSAQTPKLRYTFRPDAAEMGRKAVEILLKYDVISRPPLDELVGGKFMER